MTTSSFSSFIPAGSYQQSLCQGTVIQVTIDAECQTENKQEASASLTFNSGELDGIVDIANNNGSLALVPGTGETHNNGNPFVPAGSYLNSSSYIQITLTATCINELDQPVNSSIIYTPEQAVQYSDISNNNGNLAPLEANYNDGDGPPLRPF